MDVEFPDGMTGTVTGSDNDYEGGLGDNTNHIGDDANTLIKKIEQEWKGQYQPLTHHRATTIMALLRIIHDKNKDHYSEITPEQAAHEAAEHNSPYELTHFETLAEGVKVHPTDPQPRIILQETKELHPCEIDLHRHHPTPKRTQKSHPLARRMCLPMANNRKNPRRPKNRQKSHRGPMTRPTTNRPLTYAIIHTHTTNNITHTLHLTDNPQALADPNAKIALIYPNNQGKTTIELENGETHIGILKTNVWYGFTPQIQATHKFTCLDGLEDWPPITESSDLQNRNPPQNK